jgi:hypothetical protein
MKESLFQLFGLDLKSLFHLVPCVSMLIFLQAFMLMNAYHFTQKLRASSFELVLLLIL